MNKVICDICGTAYPESEQNCPVCGCSRDFGLEDISEELFANQAYSGQSASKKKTREIFDFDEVNRTPEMDDDLDEDDFDDEEEYEEEEKSNVGLVVVLLILIILLIVTAGFFFLRYFLPNMMPEPTQAPTVATTEYVEPETTVPEDTGIPCTDIVMPGGKVELKVGGMFLMNVQVFPLDTTDELVYVSADENIATVTADGAVTGVAEGQTSIQITCGKVSVNCNITVDNSVAEETEPEGTIPAMVVEEGEQEDATGETTDETEATEATEAAGETEETTEVTVPEGETLKLKKTDITLFGAYSSVELGLDCAIPATEIKWFTMDSTVAIVHDGVVTATGSGITRIYGEYEGQQVQCIVRCNF